MKPKYILLTLLLLALHGCNDKTCNCRVDNEILQSNDSIIKRWNYQGWWSEIGIDTTSQFDNDFYRLTIFPSWNNSTVTQYILEDKKKTPRLYVTKYLKDYSGKKYHLKKMKDSKNLDLVAKNWIEFDHFSENMCFWNMPVVNGEEYLDGVSWILEVKKSDGNMCSQKQYHIVSRVANDSSFFAICDRILKLGNSSIKEQDSLLSISWRTD